MSRRAPITQAELNRALKAAAKIGYEVRVEGAIIRFLPIDPSAVPIPTASQADSDWDRALGLK
jgi:hypothetical protein